MEGEASGPDEASGSRLNRARDPGCLLGWSYEDDQEM